METPLRHSGILVSSLWRVLPLTLSSQTDMPSLTTVTLNDFFAFSEKKTVHTRSSSSSSPSFLDITPALRQYFLFIVSLTHHFHPNTKSPFSLHTAITPFLPHYNSFICILSHAVRHPFKTVISFHCDSGDQPKCCVH